MTERPNPLWHLPYAILFIVVIYAGSWVAQSAWTFNSKRLFFTILAVVLVAWAMWEKNRQERDES